MTTRLTPEVSKELTRLWAIFGMSAVVPLTRGEFGGGPTHYASCLACGELFDAPDDDQDLYCSGCLESRAYQHTAGAYQHTAEELAEIQAAADAVRLGIENKLNDAIRKLYERDIFKDLKYKKKERSPPSERRASTEPATIRQWLTRNGVSSE